MLRNRRYESQEAMLKNRRYDLKRQWLTRTPLGYFYNAPHWGGYFEPPPPSDLRNY